VNYNYTTDGMIRFEIPIEYFKNRKPTAIVLVASASKYGDYFSGSTSSTMWIDDFELIYE
ncbi:MAG: PCMD domain-containing protein, partial [Phocaeicola sp.]